MSVRERLEDGLILWERGRKHGAWIQILIACAATSKKRFPGIGDGNAFKSFIREVTPTIIENKPAISGGVSLSFYYQNRGDGARLDDLLYAKLRCTLLHEGIMPEEVRLSESRIEGDRIVADLSGIGTKDRPLTMPDHWVLNLAKAVADAPENATDRAGLFEW